MDDTLLDAARTAADTSSFSLASAPSLSSVASRLRAAGCVFAEEEAGMILDAAGPGASGGLVDRMAERRCAGEPLEHVVGWAAFGGLRIAVGPGVFVPRRRTEFLLEQALRVGRDAAVVVDLCCGAGPLATALAVRLPRAELHAADIDPVQTAYARRNLALFADRASVHEGDLYDALPAVLRGRVELLVANAPYVPCDAIATLPAEARDHEPVLSLDGGPDGLAAQRRVADGALDWLAPGGHLLVETSERQAPLTRGVFAAAGLDARVVECEEREASVVVARRARVDEGEGAAPTWDGLSTEWAGC